MKINPEKAFKKTFPNADVSVLKSVPGLLDGTIFPIDKGGELNHGKGEEQGMLVRFDKEQHECWCEELKELKEDNDDDNEDNDKDNDKNNDDDSEEGLDTGWQIVEVYEVSVTTNTSNGMIELLPGSNDKITYELYPMEQGYEFDIYNLGFRSRSEEMNNLSNYDSEFSFNNLTFSASSKFTILSNDMGELDLYIGHYGNYTSDGGIIYLLVKEDEIISGFKDKQYTFQEGDDETKCYFYEDKIVVHNMGDVSSIVIIKI